MFPNTDQDVLRCEVLVPGWVEDAVSCGEDPFVAEQTGPTQQLLRVPLEEHHLPAKRLSVSQRPVQQLSNRRLTADAVTMAQRPPLRRRRQQYAAPDMTPEALAPLHPLC